MTDKPVLKRVHSLDELQATPGSILFSKGEPGPWTIVVDGMTDKREAAAWLYTSANGDNELLLYSNGEHASRLIGMGYTETPLYAHPQPDASALVEAAKGAAKNAEVRRVGVLLHATDWLALMEALTAWEAQHG